MIELALGLLPPALSPAASAVLLVAAVAGSFVTAAFGVGGGVLLLGIMTLFVPVSAVIPVHGVVQAGSNVWRGAILLRHVRWPLVAVFAGGGVVGAAAGSRLLIQLPEAGLELALGVFILLSCWLPAPRVQRSSLPRIALGGGVTSLLTLFVGATGPFVATLIRPLHLDRRVHVATFSACMTLQHGLKLAVFGFAGFAFGPWLPWLALMLAAAFLGTWIGRQVLERMDDRLFRRTLTVLLTVLALRLVASGLSAPDMPWSAFVPWT